MEPTLNSVGRTMFTESLNHVVEWMTLFTVQTPPMEETPVQQALPSTPARLACFLPLLRLHIQKHLSMLWQCLPLLFLVVILAILIRAVVYVSLTYPSPSVHGDPWLFPNQLQMWSWQKVHHHAFAEPAIIKFCIRTKLSLVDVMVWEFSYVQACWDV